MYNYSATLIAVLVRMKLLTPEAGEHLCNELQSKIHTSRWHDAYDLVDEVLQELEAKDKEVLMEPWMPHIRKLERQVVDLEAKLASTTKTETKKLTQKK